MNKFKLIWYDKCDEYGNVINLTKETQFYLDELIYWLTYFDKKNDYSDFWYVLSLEYEDMKLV